jgi:hypothetical protein
MRHDPTAQAGTALSPEWDRGFDEAFADLVSGDPDLVRAEFDALIGAVWQEPPTPPAPPAPSAAEPAPPQSRAAGSDTGPVTVAHFPAIVPNSHQRSPP